MSDVVAFALLVVAVVAFALASVGFMARANLIALGLLCVTIAPLVNAAHRL